MGNTATKSSASKVEEAWAKIAGGEDVKQISKADLQKKLQCKPEDNFDAAFAAADKDSDVFLSKAEFTALCSGDVDARKAEKSRVVREFREALRLARIGGADDAPVTAAQLKAVELVLKGLYEARGSVDFDSHYANTLLKEAHKVVGEKAAALEALTKAVMDAPLPLTYTGTKLAEIIRRDPTLLKDTAEDIKVDDKACCA